VILYPYSTFTIESSTPTLRINLNERTICITSFLDIVYNQVRFLQTPIFNSISTDFLNNQFAIFSNSILVIEIYVINGSIKNVLDTSRYLHNYYGFYTHALIIPRIVTIGTYLSYQHLAEMLCCCLNNVRSPTVKI
jgi:hypothetical protein